MNTINTNTFNIKTYWQEQSKNSKYLHIALGILVFVSITSLSISHLSEKNIRFISPQNLQKLQKMRGIFIALPFVITTLGVVKYSKSKIHYNENVEEKKETKLNPKEYFLEINNELKKIKDPVKREKFISEIKTLLKAIEKINKDYADKLKDTNKKLNNLDKDLALL